MELEIKDFISRFHRQNWSFFLPRHCTYVGNWWPAAYELTRQEEMRWEVGWEAGNEKQKTALFER